VAYANPAAFPAAYVSRRFERATGDAMATERLARGPADFRGHTDEVEGALPAPSPGAPVPAAVRRERSTRLVVQADNPSGRPALLVVLDAWGKGWTARARGRDLPVLRVNGAFRGVAVPPGRSAVVFEYRPWWTGWAADASVVGLALLGLALAGAWLAGAPARGRRPAPPAGAGAGG
jgi:hypothetical protein